MGRVEDNSKWAADIAIELCDIPNLHFKKKGDIFYDQIGILEMKLRVIDYADDYYDTTNTKLRKAGILHTIGKHYLNDACLEKDAEYTFVGLKKGYIYLQEAVEIFKKIYENPKYELDSEDFRGAALAAYDFTSIVLGKKKREVLDFAEKLCLESINSGESDSNDYSFLARIYMEHARMSSIGEKDSYFDLARLNMEKTMALERKRNFSDSLYLYGELLAEYSEETLDYAKRAELREEAINMFEYYDKRTHTKDGMNAIDDYFGSNE